MAIVVSSLVCLAAGIAVTFAPGPYVFAVLQFVIGGTTHGCFLAVAVMGN